MGERGALTIAQWRRRIVSRNGPPRSTQRLILLAVAELLASGRNSYTFSELETATALGRTWLSRQMTELIRLGWVTRQRHGRTLGRNYVYAYSPALPALFHAEPRREVNSLAA